jgi:hypothetical protein
MSESSAPMLSNVFTPEDDPVNATWKPAITLRGLLELPAHW